ncbi:hypothetical protein [Kordia sp.]|uniref:hypothetical protein n=1 Tax=Kordia sp. TaxID=1965332 RepID=UPI003B5BEBAC
MKDFKYSAANSCGANSCGSSGGSSSGSNGCGSSGGSSSGSNGCGSGTSTPSKQKDIAVPLELHACMGLNACKGHDRFGTNDCAGSGYCATQVHSCHTLNNCRGQGGCGLYGDSEEQCKPGANDCAWQGSCGTPIPAERFITQGKNQGRSVWQLARKLFEDRMDKSRRTVKDAPFQYGPPISWLRANGRTESCGSSGDKNCSFGLNDAVADANQFCLESSKEINNTIENCDCKEEKKKKKSSKKKASKK